MSTHSSQYLIYIIGDNKYMSIFIVTGSACCGKTTLLKRFKDENHDVYEEVPSLIIRKRREEGRYLPWEMNHTNEDVWMGFEREIYDMQVDFYTNMKDWSLIDRGTEDLLAYLRVAGINHIPHWWKPTKSILCIANRKRISYYNMPVEDVKVIILNPIEEYELNGIRNPIDNRYKEREEIINVYNEFEYDVILEDHLMTLDERYEWICSFL
jgi:predicted ATPase